MDPIKFSIENPVKVSVGVLLIALFGVLALFAIPIQLTPNVDQPIVRVTTDWVGRSPDDVEKEIIERQEEKLKSIAGLKKMSAIAYEGQSVITLEFYIGTDMREATLEVSNKLREVKVRPADSDEPVVEVSASSSESPIAWTIITADDPNFEIEGLLDYAEDYIKPHLERIDGVSEIRVYGGRKRQVQIRIDPQLMAQRAITFRDLRTALQLANVNVSAGSIADGRLDVRVRTVGEYDDLDKIRETVIAETEGGQIRVKDIGTVVLTYEKLRGFVRNKGKPGLALPIYREVGSNVMTVMEQVRIRVAEVRDEVLPMIARQVQLDQNLEKPPVFQYDQVYDETVYIDDAVSLVYDNLWAASLLTAITLLAFLRSFRPTLIISFAIPVSIIGTFVAMYGAGRNLNVVSLAGLAFAVGVVVDNATVVLENIDRHMRMGKSPKHAAYWATKEVWGAVLASTLTNIVVFGPILFIQEEAGQLFRDIALALCASVLLSAIVSITVIPSMAAYLLTVKSMAKSESHKGFWTLWGLMPLMGKMVSAFADFIFWLSAPKFSRVMARLLIIVLLTGASFVGAKIYMPPTTYLPAGNRNLVFGFIMTPPGYNKAHDRILAESVERVIRPYWEAKTDADLANCPPVIDKMTGQPIAGIPRIDNFFFVSVPIGMFTGATSVDKMNVKPLAPLLGSAISEIPGAYGGAQQRSLFEQGLGGNNRIDIEVTGFKMDEIRNSAGALFGALGQKYGMQNLRPSPGNFNVPSPELRLTIDEIRAKDLGVSNSDLGLGVQAMIDGAIIGEYRLAGKAIDILLVRDSKYELTADTIGDVPVAVRGKDGKTMIVPVSAVASFRRADAPQTIQRIEEQRSITISLSPPGDVPLETIQGQVDEVVAGLRAAKVIPPSVEVTQAGTASKLNDVRAALIGTWTGLNWESIGSLLSSRMVLAILIIYLVMAALFESWLFPFVIMFSVPPAAIGGFLALALVTKFDPTQQLDVITMLGFVILLGTVVNNAILIVHQAINFMNGIGEGEGDVVEKMDMRTAIRESVRTRVRPVMMTTVTTLTGGLPLVLLPGAGSELYRGLGAVVLGGLMLSTIYSLFVVPLVFSLTLDMKQALARMIWGAPAQPMAAMALPAAATPSPAPQPVVIEVTAPAPQTVTQTTT